MKKYYFLIISLFVLLIAACNQNTIPKNVLLSDVQGNEYSLNTNNYIILNYWAPWCKPCHEEIPELNAFYLQNKGRVALFGVNFDQAKDTELKLLAAKMGIQFPVLNSDPANLFGIKDIRGLPVTFIIHQGKVIKELYGKQTEKSLQAAIS